MAKGIGGRGGAHADGDERQRREDAAAQQGEVRHAGIPFRALMRAADRPRTPAR
jgi:hypothetical protein